MVVQAAQIKTLTTGNKQLKNFSAGIIMAGTNNRNLAGLDLLRALAICFVFLFHYPNLKYSEALFSIKEFGWTGVDLFFVLSGYLIARQLFYSINKTGNLSLKTFFIKRAFRILPAYLFIILVYFSIPAFRERESLPPLWKFLTFTQNIGLDPSVSGTFSHAWSLCIEEQFYFSFPFILLALAYFKKMKKGFYLLLGLFMFTWLIRLFIWNKYMLPMEDADIDTSSFWVTWMYYPTYTRLDGLLTGISIAGIFEFFPIFKTRIIKYGNWFLLTGIAVLVGAWFLCTDRISFAANIFGFPVIALGFGMIVIAALSPGCILYNLKLPGISNLAILSYSIYLSHKGIIHLCQEYFSRHGIAKESYAMLFICIAFSLFTAFLMRYIIEKPFLKIRDKLLMK
jgi:peptidoglycan/LPS O-acetylase OafA/YrhL